MARVMPGRGHHDKSTKMHHMHIEKADGGGHIIEHHTEHSPMAMGEEHVIARHSFGKGQKHLAAAHIAKHIGIEPLEENEPEEAATGGSQDGGPGADDVAMGM
jgi:hypothetical protein